MRIILNVCLTLLCIICVLTGFVSATNINSNISVEKSADNASVSFSDEAIKIIRNSLESKISSGEIQKFIPSFSEDQTTKLVIGPIIPLYSLYNTKKGSDYSDMLNTDDFKFASEPSECCAFVYSEGVQTPVMFYSFYQKEDVWKRSSVQTTDGYNGFGQNVILYEKLAITHQCSDVIAIGLFNDFALVFIIDGNQVVMPSTLMQHKLGISNPEDQPQLFSTNEFIEYVNKSIDRFQKQQESDSILFG
jgi:type I restriction-modification system DNA methylase subunit